MAASEQWQEGPARAILITRMVVRPELVAHARGVFVDMQADVHANEAGTVFYQYYQDEADPTVFWVHEVFADDEAKRVHLGRHGKRRADFDLILAEPPVFNAVREL